MADREISPAEAARKLGVALPYIYSLIWSGKLNARKVNRQWRVSTAGVEARLKARGE